MRRSMRALASMAWLGIVSLMTVAAEVREQDQTQEQKHWTITPYLWMSGLTGQVSIRDLSADVDESFSDIFHDLKFASMAYFEWRYRPWTIGLDVFYVSLKE